MQLSTLWRAPEVNPINRKARSIPVLNIFNVYARAFHFSWLGFMIAFWAWYTFPPLLTVTIKKDLNLTTAQVANSNIVSLVATLFMRLIAGPACDRFGSRLVFGSLLLIGSLPIGLAPLIQNATGLYISRFFIGVLGATFVPCQVWCTGFFDKNVVGTANALAGGWGNAGGGITYFVMPAVYDSFVHARGYSPSQAWRLTFIVPVICLIVCGLSLILLCEDTPTGKWADRHLHAQENLQNHGVNASVNSTVVDVPGGIADRNTGSTFSDEEKNSSHGKSGVLADQEAPLSSKEMLETAQGDTVVNPSFKEAMKVVVSPQTIFHVATYGCSFGGELAINAVLSSYYLKNFPALGQTGASNWAAMFGFLNVITRPAGGVVSDLLYRYGGQNLWLKKGWITVCGVLTGALLILIGQLNPHQEATMFGLVFLMAVFHEAGNGANFGLIPHVHGHANGIVSGVTGAGGNLGGVIFAIIFRFMDNGTNYAKGFWVIGVIHIAVNLLVSWVHPLPKSQRH
ncbi:Nitrate transporter [Colletotrichum sidae]|uniref:Nitrate/nitrite transporter n=2 Tax=Colletotrichum orbiculare species complex TaxID=2707354 RepID=A0A4V3HQ42_9PEZI|nr:Nitrate transporter [Colletotrichum spinosum]TEA14194.1 Nitrate transporter [Colletotrichum sidae]